jgi:hypothetical protein
VVNFQNIVASLIVLAAASWLAKQIYRVFRAASGKTPISGCDHCPKNQDPGQTNQVVEINRRSDS